MGVLVGVGVSDGGMIVMVYGNVKVFEGVRDCVGVKLGVGVKV
jgi:hypothetical protein